MDSSHFTFQHFFRLFALALWAGAAPYALAQQQQHHTGMAADVLPPNQERLTQSTPTPSDMARDVYGIFAENKAVASATPATGTIHSVPNPPPGSAPFPDISQTPPIAAAAADAMPPLNESGPSPMTGDLSQKAATTSAAPTQNAVLNLINRLVKKGILTQEEANEMIDQAQADAESAKAQADATQEALTQASAAQAAVAQSAPASDDAVRVTYVPEVVKAQMREQIKEDVMAQAREERWAAPRLLPAWVTNVHPFGDIRVRFESDTFPAGNDNTGAFPNFNAINTGPPFDVSGNQFSPQLNVDQNRERFRLRARFGADIDLADNFSSGFRIATGETNSPTSANQSLGAPYQGQGGDFSKYAIWLDRAFIKYELWDEPEKSLSLTVGRFDNPFFTVSQIMWDDDIGFDGAAIKGKYEVIPGVRVFGTGGAFPVFNTDLNFSSNQPAKFASYDKYLFAGQLGVEWQINKDLNLTVATAYYYFQNIEGKLSSPFTPLTASDAGNTDDSRPSFAQKGNTYMAIRDIVANASNDFGTIDQYQYFGLATPFHDFSVNARLDYTHFEPVRVSLSGEFISNLAFDKNAINTTAVNNRGSIDNTVGSSVGSFDGGNNAWIVQLEAGSVKFEKRWDWNVGISYRYVESDSVVDGFCDSDFGGGGTNMKGYTIGGNLALSPNVWIGARYMSATGIAGPTFKADVFQFDLNAKF